MKNWRKSKAEIFTCDEHFADHICPLWIWLLAIFSISVTFFLENFWLLSCAQRNLCAELENLDPLVVLKKIRKDIWLGGWEWDKAVICSVFIEIQFCLLKWLTHLLHIVYLALWFCVLFLFSLDSGRLYNFRLLTWKW